jgi:hypothetical protein
VQQTVHTLWVHERNVSLVLWRQLLVRDEKLFLEDELGGARHALRQQVHLLVQPPALVGKGQRKLGQQRHSELSPYMHARLQSREAQVHHHGPRRLV